MLRFTWNIASSWAWLSQQSESVRELLLRVLYIWRLWNWPLALTGPGVSSKWDIQLDIPPDAILFHTGRLEDKIFCLPNIFVAIVCPSGAGGRFFKLHHSDLLSHPFLFTFRLQSSVCRSALQRHATPVRDICKLQFIETVKCKCSDIVTVTGVKLSLSTLWRRTGTAEQQLTHS